jgi:hypothetical protein
VPIVRNLRRHLIYLLFHSTILNIEQRVAIIFPTHIQDGHNCPIVKWRLFHKPLVSLRWVHRLGWVGVGVASKIDREHLLAAREHLTYYVEVGMK